MGSRVACTIVARNYVPQARVLKSSFSEFNDCEFVTLIVDGLDEDRLTGGVGTVVLPADLDLDAADLHEMMAIYDVMEFSTALKPSLLMHLLRSHETAVYFDPDIQVFADLADVFKDARDHGVLLTPHVLEPMPRDRNLVSEHLIMVAGIFNLGFIGVGPGSYRFLVWWAEHLRFDAISDPAQALFTDQRWIDWVPALFPHAISRDAGLNAAHWNLHERPISRRDGALFAGEAPLRFLHFSGYDVRQPWLLSKHPGIRPRVLLSAQPELRLLCDAYGRLLTEAGIENSRRVGYRYATLENGLTLDLAIRRLLRAIYLGEIRPDAEVPRPFDDADGFVRWLLTPSFGERSARLTPLEYAVWLSRQDLQQAFPDVLHVSGNAFRDWFAADPETRSHLATVAALAPTQDAPLADPIPSGAPDGWTVLVRGGHDRDSVEVARRVTDAIIATGVRVDVMDDEDDRRPATAAVHGNLLMILAAGVAPPSDVDVIRQRITGRRVILVVGSAEDVRRDPLLDLDADEVWVVGTATAAAARTRRYVNAVRFPIRTTGPGSALHRGDIGVPDGRTLVLVDVEAPETLTSTGALQAVRALSDRVELVSTVQLVVPVDGMSVPDRERLLALAVSRPWLTLLETELGVHERAKLVEIADVLLSFHSGPGLRLGELEALAVGTPIVARRDSLSSDLLPGESAFVADDDEEIALAVLNLIRLPGTAGPAGIDQATRRLSLSAVAAEFRQLLNHSSGGSS